MVFRQWRHHLQWKLLIPVGALGVGLFVFQNCSKTGSTAGLGSMGAGALNAILTTKDMPVRYSFNQISYMSCPLAGASGNATVNPNNSAFYRLRFGAFDNSSNNGFSTDPSGNNYYTPSHVAGLGFTAKAIGYQLARNPNPSPTDLTNYLNTSTYSANAQPMTTLLYPIGGGRQGGAGTINYQSAATYLLAPLSNNSIATALVNSPVLPIPGSDVVTNQSSITNENFAFGLTPMSYFSNLPDGENSILGTLIVANTNNIHDEAAFRRNLDGQSGGQLLVAGFAPPNLSSMSAMTNGLIVPSGSSLLGSIYALGYSFSFNTNEASIAQNGIQEYDLSTWGGAPQSPIPGEQWDCFSLTVVRDVDRKYWTWKGPQSGQQSKWLNDIIGPSNADGVYNIVNFGQNNVMHPKDVQFNGGPNGPYVQENYLRNDSGAQDIPVVMYELSTQYLKILNDYFANLISNPKPNTTTTNPPTYRVSKYSAYAPSGQLAIGTYLTPGNGTLPIYGGSNPSIPNIMGLNMGAAVDDGGTYFACPPESHKDFSDPIKAERLRIVRRFLPASQWDVNIGLMCAVPLTSGLNTGGGGSGANAGCYAVGDSNLGNYVQYQVNGQAPTPGTNCDVLDANGNLVSPECPAKVSFCWRYK